MKRIPTILLLCILSLQLVNCKKETSYNSEIVLKGKVIDSFSNKPIPGVRVSVLKGTGIAMSSKTTLVRELIANTDGNFEMKFYPDQRANYYLRFSSDIKLSNDSADFWGGILSRLYPLDYETRFDSYSKETYNFDVKLNPAGLIEFTEDFTNPEYGCHIRGIDNRFDYNPGFLPLQEGLAGMYYPTAINSLFRYNVYILHNADTVKHYSDSVFCKPYQRNTQLIRL